MNYGGMILVDSSVWIQSFRRGQWELKETLAGLLNQGRLATAGVIMAELIWGALSEREATRYESLAQAMPVLPDDENTWIGVGRLALSFRKSGITIPLSDLLIAQLAIENDCELYTLDSHFDQIPNLPRFKPG